MRLLSATELFPPKNRGVLKEVERRSLQALKYYRVSQVYESAETGYFCQAQLQQVISVEIELNFAIMTITPHQ